MRKIKYDTLPNAIHGGAQCQTPCTFFPNIMVGGLACAECKHYNEEESDEKEVACKHP